ncbi:hypothetical protein D3C87_2097980 [compost metagenome]
MQDGAEDFFREVGDAFDAEDGGQNEGSALRTHRLQAMNQIPVLLVSIDMCLDFGVGGFVDDGADIGG